MAASDLGIGKKVIFMIEFKLIYLGITYHEKLVSCKSHMTRFFRERIDFELKTSKDFKSIP